METVDKVERFDVRCERVLVVGARFSLDLGFVRIDDDRAESVPVPARKDWIESCLDIEMVLEVVREISRS